MTVSSGWTFVAYDSNGGGGDIVGDVGGGGFGGAEFAVSGDRNEVNAVATRWAGDNNAYVDTSGPTDIYGNPSDPLSRSVVGGADKAVVSSSSSDADGNTNNTIVGVQTDSIPGTSSSTTTYSTALNNPYQVTVTSDQALEILQQNVRDALDAREALLATPGFVEGTTTVDGVQVSNIDAIQHTLLMIFIKIAQESMLRCYQLTLQISMKSYSLVALQIPAKIFMILCLLIPIWTLLFREALLVQVLFLLGVVHQ